MDMLAFMAGSFCGFLVGASTVCLFTINGSDWGEPEPPEHTADADIPDFLRRQAD